MHVDEEQVQRLVDDELDELAGPADEWVREHVVHCESCRERVARAASEQEEMFALLANLDHPRARVDPARVMARGRARDLSWMRKAAGFVVAAALAGAAYAAPGSPLPSLLTRVLGPVVDAPVAPVVQVPDAPVVSGVTVATGNRMMIVFATTQSRGEIRVTLSDDQETAVRATGPGASYTADEEVLTIDNASSLADFSVAIPRNARLVEVRIGADLVFLKDGARIVSEYGVAGADVWVIPLTR